MRLGLVKHRVGELVPEGELRRLALTMTKARAAQFLGVHYDTVYRLARAYRITFLPAERGRRGYGWHGVERRVG